ncbi:MAG: hypothetical protein ABH951_00055 [Patescibacteria group bacterium]
MQKNKGVIHIFLIVLGIVVILFIMGFFTSRQNIDSAVNVLNINK